MHPTLFALALNGAAYARTWTVDPAGGGDATKIQTAINSAASGDTISVKAGTYKESLNTKGKKLTITSVSGATKTIVDGTGGDHVLEVASGETVTFTGFTLTGGSHGVSVDGSKLTASDIIVKSVTGEAPGGGFNASGGATLTVSDCAVSGVTIQNSAYGGALFIDTSTASFSDCSFSTNTADEGGGAYLNKAVVTFTDVTFDGNTSLGHGGGVRAVGGSTLTATRLTLSDNVATSRGGGMQLDESELTCQACVITGNRAGSSGGGLSLEGSGGQTVTFSGSTSEIRENRSGGAGGGVYSTGVDLTLRGALADNWSTTTSSSGQGLYFIGGDLTLTSLDVSGHSGGSGAAIYVAGASGETVSASGGLWSGNTTTGDGGALYSEAPVTLSGVSVQDNRATTSGGGVSVKSAAVTITDGDFTRNEAVYGGGLYVYKAAVTLKRTAFVQNEAQTGGGLYHHAVDQKGANVTLSKVSFTKNVATSRGGGLASDDAKTVTSSRDTFTGNSPEGASVLGGNNVYVKGSSFTDNAGAGLSVESAKLGELEALSLRGNGGDGLILASSGAMSVHNNVAVGNGAAGFLVSAPLSGVVLQNNDAVANRVGVDLQYGVAVTVTNTIAALNTEDGFRVTSHSPVIQYCDSSDNGDDWGDGLSNLTGTSGNLSADPRYTGFTDDGDPDNDLLYLSSSSPCRDTGDPSISDPDGGRSDMGSFGGPDADNTDADGDGFKPSDGDCDESDAAVNPGAEEVYYDGLDGDCAGGDDYDQDGDGWAHPSGASGEADCDDEDAEVNPGATDADEDGVDQDCDGIDGEATAPGDSGEPTDDSGEPIDTDTGPLDEDKDGDGLTAAEGDCDDLDALTSPAEDESCSDGKDNDCDGLGDSLDEDCDTKGAGPSCAAVNPGAGRALFTLALAVAALRRRRGSPGTTLADEGVGRLGPTTLLRSPR
ncbi:right-handed parallel beta-helix repeat-containing protein [Myxococcota bacterium]|nr:right-handed parallel beta-helix repeat-containing protein [Myxococcota bacterium]